MRSAFTLIELVVVMVVLAILSSLAVFSLAATADRYQLSRAAEIVEMFDARARRDARSSQQPLQAVVDRGRGRLQVNSSGTTEDATFRLPARVEISEIRLQRQLAVGKRVEIDVSSEGRCPTYAVALRRGKLTRWLVILGQTGQVIPLENEGEVDAILSL